MGGVQAVDNPDIVSDSAITPTNTNGVVRFDDSPVFDNHM